MTKERSAGILAHERLLRLLQINAQSLLGAFDEPMAIMYVVSWQPSLGDLPFGGVVVRSESSHDPAVLSDCLAQSSKLLQHIVSVGEAQSNQRIETQLTYIQQLRNQIKELEQQSVTPSIQSTAKEDNNGEEKTRSPNDSTSAGSPG